MPMYSGGVTENPDLQVIRRKTKNVAYTKLPNKQLSIGLLILPSFPKPHEVI